MARNLLSSARVVRNELMSPMAMLVVPRGKLWSTAERFGVVRQEEVCDKSCTTLGLMTSETKLPWSRLSSRMEKKCMPTSRTLPSGLLSTVLVTWSAPGDRTSSKDSHDIPVSILNDSIWQCWALKIEDLAGSNHCSKICCCCIEEHEFGWSWSSISSFSPETWLASERLLIFPFVKLL